MRVVCQSHWNNIDGSENILGVSFYWLFLGFWFQWFSYGSLMHIHIMRSDSVSYFFSKSQRGRKHYCASAEPHMVYHDIKMVHIEGGGFAGAFACVTVGSYTRGACGSALAFMHMWVTVCMAHDKGTHEGAALACKPGPTCKSRMTTFFFLCIDQTSLCVLSFSLDS